MEIILFALRISFTVLIYVFICGVLYYLIKDLRTDAEVVPATKTVQTFGSIKNGQGVLCLESAPPEYTPDSTKVVLNRQLRIGRGLDNDIVLPDKYASVNHARLYTKQGQFWVEDLNSKNGTFLNDKPLEGATLLVNGDEIRIGAILFRFVRWGL